MPECLVRAVLAAMHAYSHPGERKLDVLCCRRFLFPFSPRKLIAEAFAQCRVCHSCKAPNRSGTDSLEHFPITSTPFSSVSMDFVELDSVKVDRQNFHSALIVVCRLSGYIIVIPTRKKGLDAANSARIFLERFVSFMGILREILSDNDHLVTSEFSKTFCAQSGIEQHQRVIYRPQSRGRADVAVKAVVNALRRFLEERPGNWFEALPMALWGLNDLPGAVGPYSNSPPLPTATTASGRSRAPGHKHQPQPSWALQEHCHPTRPNPTTTKPGSGPKNSTPGPTFPTPITTHMRYHRPQDSTAAGDTQGRHTARGTQHCCTAAPTAHACACSVRASSHLFLSIEKQQEATKKQQKNANKRGGTPAMQPTPRARRTQRAHR